jgi:hypothetical protein
MKRLFILGVLCLLCSISAISQSKKEWERAQAINTWNVYQQFINNYPNGKYTELAKQKLAQLKKPDVTTKETEVKQPTLTIQNNDQKPQISNKERNKNKLKDPIYSGDPTPKYLLNNNSGLDVKSQITDQIVIKKGRCYLNDKKLKNKDLKELLKGDPESAKEYKKSQAANVNSIVALIIVDGILVATTGYILGVIPGVLITVPFSMSSVKHLNEAIKIYNSKHISGSNAGV